MTEKLRHRNDRFSVISFLNMLREQVRIGTFIGINGGMVLGLVVGLALISMENSYLIGIRYGAVIA